MDKIFILYSDNIANKAFEIFEALDHDQSESADYFKEKCCEVSPSLLITLRDKRLGNEGRTLLHNASRNGSLLAVLSLLRLGHKVDIYDSCVSKRTPLMDAILVKQIEVCVVLIEGGASLFTQDVNNENALHYAARTGSLRLIKSIITASRLQSDKLSNLTNSRSIKKQLPEDLSSNEAIKEYLKAFRYFSNL